MANSESLPQSKIRRSSKNPGSHGIAILSPKDTPGQGATRIRSRRHVRTGIFRRLINRPNSNERRPWHGFTQKDPESRRFPITRRQTPKTRQIPLKFTNGLIISMRFISHSSCFEFSGGVEKVRWVK
jgi:hypothetical protein